MPFAQASEFDKQPANADKKFQSANDFYKKVNQSEYSELPNASFNTRQKVLFKDANVVISHIPEKFSASSIGRVQLRATSLSFCRVHKQQTLFSLGSF
jgi:hypothetical protein